MILIRVAFLEARKGHKLPPRTARLSLILGFIAVGPGFSTGRFEPIRGVRLKLDDLFTAMMILADVVDNVECHPTWN